MSFIVWNFKHTIFLHFSMFQRQENNLATWFQGMQKNLCILGGLCFDILKAYSYITLICSQCLQRQKLLDAVTPGDHLNVDIQMKEILLSGCVCVIDIIALFFVWNIYFSIWCMDHMLFGVSLKFTRGVSTGTLLVSCSSTTSADNANLSTARSPHLHSLKTEAGFMSILISHLFQNLSRLLPVAS